MPSHLSDDDERPEGISRMDVLGNRVADKYAGQAAKRLKLGLDVATSYIYYGAIVGGT